MENEKPSIDVLSSMLTSLPREYIESSIIFCNPRNYSECIDKLIKFNELYPQCCSGEKFKVYECILQHCKIKNCPFYHKSNERRRDLSKYAYEPRACFAVLKGGI